ncbi:putative Histidine kinase [Desulfamplus magnetovallimortis]|uniref:histidine kinase n=1 Tax=Desulfamplus magnetovallimortis TaxID=1246637 RepID=A0A1W1H7A1_9BACT|nr:hybrid sensor histidine kinase/response regulator [Desulfamplus magnetovallimortis]SLM28339.1 putative Histidine kinase [Desulfamplus magnetovallimortis]
MSTLATIMIVEDEVLIADAIRESLESMGYSIVSSVTSGEEAVVDAEDKKPDIVLMDIRLSGEMDGIDAADHIYSSYGIPVIFLTAYAEDALLQRASSVGSFGYLLKPFEEYELKAAIEMAIYKARTDRKIKEQERLLRQATKMEAMGTLAGGIAHDFNNLLSIITGYTELLEDDLQSAGMDTEKTHEILKASFRAKKLINQILMFSRKRERRYDIVDIVPIVKETIKFMRASIPSMVFMDYSIEPNLGTILGDPTQIHQVLINLCTNAAQAMEEEGGELFVKITRKILEEPLNCSGVKIPSGRYICISVKDTGPGISKEHIEKIFDPYFTTKEVGKGSGMGLSVVMGIVKSHKGGIIAENSPGSGAIFRVYLPELDDPALTEEFPFDGTVEESGNEHILLVDDDPVVEKVARSMLKKLGYRLTSFTDSQQTFDTFRKNPEIFDLLMTDYTMPGLTGMTLARKCMDIRPDLPVLLCTGYSCNVNEKKAMENGIMGYMMKPFSRKELASKLRFILDR